MEECMMTPPKLKSCSSIRSTYQSSNATNSSAMTTTYYQYAFMLPVSTLVALCAQLCGIGGAAMFSPIFLLLFPLLNLQLHSPQQAVASALLTEVFGFASGLIGYSCRGLIDWKTARKYIVISAPSALVGALLARFVCENVLALRLIYSALMIGLAVYLWISGHNGKSITDIDESTDGAVQSDVESGASAISKKDGSKATMKTLTARNGMEYTYLDIDLPNSKSLYASTIFGSVLTGMLGVGIGEVVLPQLVRRKLMPLPVAAGTSVYVVVVTALTAAVVQFLSLAHETLVVGDISTSGVHVVPWELVVWTIPGVIIGGQLASYVASKRLFSDEHIVRFASILFGSIGIAFLVKACLRGDKLASASTIGDIEAVRI